MLDKNELLAFDKAMDITREGRALQARGDFILAFPLRRLRKLTVDDYVTGTAAPTFCNFVEARTNDWAHIKGSTAFKFGIYFGVTKSSDVRQFRFTKKFGNDAFEAFRNVKSALLALVQAGEDQAFDEIDANPLSQLFKAKILSLYFPDKYLNVCSSEHLEIIATELQLPESRSSSEYQYQLAKFKDTSPITKSWSNPKFMEYLYAKFVWEDLATLLTPSTRKPTKRPKPDVDFADLTAKWQEIGKISEEYALDWEKRRLEGLYPALASRIKDVRKKPAYGFDFLSFENKKDRRYIEVKSAGFDHRTKSFRFFLSTNEYAVSRSEAHANNYFFYVVFFRAKLIPKEIRIYRAAAFYANCELEPGAYVARFQVLSEVK